MASDTESPWTTPEPWELAGWTRETIQVGNINGDGYAPVCIVVSSIEDGHVLRSAPRLYAALETVEWGGRGFVDYETDYAACPACGGYDPSDLAEGNYYYEENKDYIGHRDGCQLDAALAQARGENA